ncbi:MAG TPA: FHA domain-containing protein [Ktedonobacteraceae bacterium]|nr:FHA domain-containing protein [Ktedonobacteraceae bacterium]
MEAALVGASGRTTLGTATLSIGRRADNILVLEDAKSSSHHAEIRPMGEGYCIVDLGSTNGTFVNEQRLGSNTPQTLNANDIIRIGDTRFTYEAQTYIPTVFDAPQNNQAYLPTVAAAPPAFPGAPQNPAPGFYSSSPAYPPAEQIPPYGATVAAPSPYTAYQGGQGQVPPPPAYDIPSPYQQPPQYYPPYGGQPPAPAAPPNQPSGASLTTRFKTNQRFRLYVIGAGAVILLLIIGFVVYAAGSTPTKTLNQYCNDFKAGDFSSAYDLLSSTLQTNISRAQYISIEQKLFTPVGGVTTCSVSNVNESDPSANGNIDYTLGNGQAATGVYTLVDQNGGWKVSNEVFR